MGSFAYTCSVSGLPIEAGDPVRFFTLVENPFEGKGNTCTVYGRWMLHTFPLKGTYNDYGSVENVKSGPILDLWLKAFRKGLVERGVGDNPAHDTQVLKSMGFQQILDAALH